MAKVTNQTMEDNIFKANILVEALPYINTLRNKTVVIKYGGNAMTDENAVTSIMQDVATLKIVGCNPVLVHGGGPEINNMLKRLGIESKFSGGLRITDKETMEVVQMVLGGKINKNISSRLNTLGVKAVGLCGKDGNLLFVEKLPPQNGVDLGYVGNIKSVNTELITKLCEDGYIPVISSIGVDDKGESYNINADTAASEIAAELNAEKLLFLTDIDGLRKSEKDPDTLISEISVQEIYKMIERGEISGGMIPKAMACVTGVENGIKKVHIINGTLAHPILLELFTDKGIGTMVHK